MISTFLLFAVVSAAGASYRIEPAPQGDLYVPEKADRLTPKVLTIHGGGWRAQDRSSFRGVAEALASRGAIVYNVDYRLTTEAPWPACGDDCLAAAEWLSAWRTNDFTETIFTVGGSSGGHLSLMTGLRFDRRKVAGVISLSGIADAEPDRAAHPGRYDLLLKGLDDAASARAFPMAYVARDLPDILLTHYYFDTVVPIVSAKNFESKLRDAGAFVETYYYDFGRENEGHAIWVKGSNPHRLYPDIEDRIWRFITERFGQDALTVVGTVKAKSSHEVSETSTVSVGFEGLDRHLFDPEPCYDKLAETGVKRARIQAGWSLCEPSKGVYDFSELDAVVSNLTVRGIEPWMMVGFGNTNWMGKCYTPAAVGCMPLYYGPDCQAAWERFVAKLAARYAKEIRHWEIWNEPDIDSFWQPRQPSAADYAKLVKLTGGIIRRAVPDAKIGGVCSTVLNDWLREAVPLAAGDVDFWSIHAYGVMPELARGEQRDPNGKEWDFVGQVASVRELFVKAGRPNVEIWQAEAGFPSWFKANHWLLGQNREGLSCEEWQAKWLLRRFLSDRRAGCSSSSFYAAADICRSYSMATTTQAHPAEHGLLDSRRGYARKASHRAMSVYNATLAEAKLVSTRKVGEVVVDEYERSGRRLIAYYRPDNLMENRPASTWDAGESLLPSGGCLTDLLTGRIYARSEKLPLRDYPMLWTAASSPWRALIADDGGAYFRGTVMTPEKAPVSFVYDGRRRNGFVGCEVLERSLETAGVETSGRLRVRVDATLVAEIEGTYRADFGETEYVLWFENDGKGPSKTLSDVICCSYDFDNCSEEETCPRLRGIRGDHENQYRPYEIDCWNQPKGFRIEGRSRPTHVEFPYFNMFRKDGGLLCAIGWAGNWRADFDNLRDCPRSDWRYRISIRACPAFASVLLPGERIRTARVVLLPHKGSDVDHVSNLWRAWFRKYNEPKANAAGEALRPLTTAYFALDTGRPNSDGSVSENADTWRPTLEKLVAERVVPDFRWFDAGWYFDPRGETIASAWYDVGSWALDTVKWPDGSFRASVDAGHAVGMKTLVWFEPERVCDPAALAANFGYRTEWALPNGDSPWQKGSSAYWNNLGDPACWTWTLGRIFAMMDAGDVDLYREDHNVSPAAAWREGDRRSEAVLKLPRRGITETKGVMGHWALWDAIIERGRRLGRCTFVDSCASGGGRNDLESLRRGVPFTRSDQDRARTELRLSMDSSFCRWIPFHGSGSPSWEGGLGPEGTFGSDPYDFRAALLPIYNSCAEFSHNLKLDYDLLRRNVAEWRSVSDLLVKDFYVITSWHSGLDAGTWDVFAYDDAEKGESIILAFRQAESPYPSCEARLKFADPSAVYEITDVDAGRTVRRSGRDLRERGYLIVLPERKSSALLRLKRM